LQGASPEQVLLDQLLPLFADILGDFGESISWQIDKSETVVNLKEVDQLRTARPGTGFSQSVGPHQRIQQAGFADITAAQKSDFRFRLRRKLLRSGCTYYKPGGHVRGRL